MARIYAIIIRAAMIDDIIGKNTNKAPSINAVPNKIRVALIRQTRIEFLDGFCFSIIIT